LRYTKFWQENLKGSDRLGNVGVDGRYGQRKINFEGVEWVELSQDSIRGVLL